MSDIVDKAQQLEDENFQRALQNVMNTPSEAAEHDADGNRICIDCSERIPAMRRKAVPRAVRCVLCQQAAEV